jgi:hypothetical protein
MTERDPFAEGKYAARETIPAESNPYSDGSTELALWAAGHEKIAGAIEARESEGSWSQPIRFRPFLKRGPLAT